MEKYINCLNEIFKKEHKAYKIRNKVRARYLIRSGEGGCVPSFKLRSSFLIVNITSLNKTDEKKLETFINENDYFSKIRFIEDNELGKLIERENRLLIKKDSYIFIGFDRDTLLKYNSNVKKLSEYDPYKTNEFTFYYM